MLFSSLVIITAAISATLVGAQSDTASSAAPTSTAGISPCVLQCVGQASTSAGCSGITDVQCLCTSTTFQSTAAACLQANCTAADLAAGQSLQQQECATVSGASSLSGSATLSASSEASSAVGSATSAASSALSSVSSVASSGASSIGSILSSATSAASSAASGAASNSATGSKASFNSGVFFTAAFSALGIAVGALLV